MVQIVQSTATERSHVVEMESVLTVPHAHVTIRMNLGTLLEVTAHNVTKGITVQLVRDTSLPISSLQTRWTELLEP